MDAIVTGQDGKAVLLSKAPPGAMYYTNRLAMEMVQHTAHPLKQQGSYTTSVHWKGRERQSPGFVNLRKKVLTP